MATSDDSLESALNRATDPSQPEEDWDKIEAFCKRVNAELEGPLLSTRLISHKVQSPQEREALYALSTLEACVKECGRYFHQEIGKFRFLNEIIKVVSPKYLGNKSSEKVKKRCVEILYGWSKGLPHEPKISEAYKMLKGQGIIKEDPTYVDREFFPFPPPKPRKADFEDDEKAKTLERLLRSKNPEDLQAANRLIKNMVKADAEKTEKRSRRINELESVSNQVKLLTEMISQFSAASSREEKEMMKELYENLEKQRPNLFRLASDTEENDNDGITDILEANDTVTRVMTLYKHTVEGEQPAGDYTPGGVADSLMLDLGLDGSRVAANSSTNSTSANTSALLENDFKNLGLGDMNDLGSIFSSAQTQQQTTGSGMVIGQTTGASGLGASSFGLGQQGMMGMATAQGASPGMPQGPPPTYSAISHNMRPMNSAASPAPNLLTPTSSSPQTSGKSSSLADLDILDKSLHDYNLSKEAFPVKQLSTGKIPLNQMAFSKSEPGILPTPAAASVTVAQVMAPTPLNPTPASSQLISTDTSSDFTPMVSTPPEVKPPELLPLTNIFVPLEKIQPAPGVPSLTAYEKNGVKVVLHFAADRPRPDVLAMVVSSLSTSPTPISSFAFQAAVPKAMKVKLQPPSSSDFPAYNPILPPTAITQVMLVANPRKEKVRLKYKLIYTLDGKQVSDVGDIDSIPLQ